MHGKMRSRIEIANRAIAGGNAGNGPSNMTLKAGWKFIFFHCLLNLEVKLNIKFKYILKIWTKRLNCSIGFSWTHAFITFLHNITLSPIFDVAYLVNR